MRYFPALIACMSFAAGPLSAATSTYTDLAGYNAATGSETLFLDFDGLPTGLSNGDFTGVDFGSPEAYNPNWVFLASDALTDAGSSTAPNSVGPVGGVFDAVVFGFRLVFSSSGSPQTIAIFDEANALIDTVVTPASGFFGLVSTTGIKSFIIDNGTVPTGNPDRFFIDDFGANAAIPLPASLPALLAALGALAALRRRTG